MNEKYLVDEDMVHFNLSSKLGINGEIILPITLVEDLKEHAHAYDGVVKYPLNTIIMNALMVYMDYINCELVRFDCVKPFIEECAENVEQVVV